MEIKEAIEVLKSNYPDACYSMLREAVDIAIATMEEQMSSRPSTAGRLIDADALWVEINKICDRRDAGIIADLTCVQQILSALRHAPTIIPADTKRGDDE